MNLSTYQFSDYISSVNTGLLNEKKQAPVHLATELNKVNALKVMGQYRKIIDIQKGGEHGRTGKVFEGMRECR